MIIRAVLRGIFRVLFVFPMDRWLVLIDSMWGKGVTDNGSWFADGKVWYYANKDGEMLTGWQKIDGAWYYFRPDGSLVSGGWYYISEETAWGYFGEDGAFGGYTPVIDGVTYEHDTAASATTVIVTGYSGSAKSLTIPETIGGHRVTEIGPEAFMGNTTLESIDLPDSIAWIDARAFKNCTKLATMN